MKRSIQFRLTAFTDPAGKRTELPPLYGNEDNFFVVSDLSGGEQGGFMTDEPVRLSDCGCLMAVADGMGGMNAGEVASQIAVETIARHFAPENLTSDVTASARSRERYMEQVVEAADAAIKAEARNNPECEGMGSTIIMVWLCDGQASVTWCGDSRAYLFREPQGIVQISKDHSYVQSLVDEGKITEAAAFDHPYGNIITRSLGDPEKKAKADSRTIPVCKGDILLVCSDGLSGVLRDRKTADDNGNFYPGENLEDLVRANRSSMAACREALWAAAENADWYDNVTAILCEILDGEEAVVPVCPGGKSDDSLKSKSYIDFKLHKKTLFRWIAAVAVVLAGLAAFACYKYFYSGDGMRTYTQSCEALSRRADSLGIAYIREKTAGLLLKEAPDTAELHAVECDLAMRIRWKNEIRTMKMYCDSSCTGLHKVLDSLETAVSECENVDGIGDGISKTGEDIREMTSFLNEIYAFTEGLSDRERQDADRFVNDMKRKTSVTATDRNKWERLKNRIKAGRLLRNTADRSEGAESPASEGGPTITEVTPENE